MGGPSGGVTMNPLLQVAYGFLPHYQLFDLTQKLVYDWAPINFTTVLFLTVYGLIIGPIWLWFGWLRFRGQAV